MLGMEETLTILDRIVELPSAESVISVLKMCRKNKSLAYAKRVLAHVCNNGLEVDSAVGNYIVPMFVGCGRLPDAQQVFNRLVQHNSHSWTSLILGCIQCGQTQQALNLYYKMQEHRVLHTNRYVLTALLKVSAKLKDVKSGQMIHLAITQNGSEIDLFVGSTLINMYSKCGSLAEARLVFDKFPIRNVVTWGALIAGYIEHGHGQEALKCFEHMQLEGFSPNAVTFVYVLKACGSIGALSKAQDIHAEIIRKGFDRELFVGSALVDMYAKCGSLPKAREVVNKLQVRNVVFWTTIIAAYAEHGPAQEALSCFEEMQLEGISPDAVTFLCILKACGSIEAICKGREIHAKIAQRGFERELHLGSTLVDMYARCGSMSEAQEVFDKLPVRDVVSWAALISGYAEHGPGQEALKCFEQMGLGAISPSTVTFVSVLKSCSSIGAIEKGREIHRHITQEGFERDVFVGSTLVDMYAKCASLSEAQDVFDKLPGRNVVSWAALISGYVEHGPGQEAVKRFEQMQLEGVSPSAAVYACILKACSTIATIGKGLEIHAEVAQKGYERDLYVGNTLVDMYVKCGSISEARLVFEKLPIRDDVSWAVLIAGYAEYGPEQEALKCFEQMQLDGSPPSDITFVSVLKSCSSVGAIDTGRQIHKEIAQKGFERKIFVSNTLVDMYAKCGSLSEAREVFDKLPDQDVVSWAALIAGYTEHGPCEKALECFEQMQLQRVCPDIVTYVFLLKACGTIGALGKGRGLHAEVTRKGFEGDLFVGSTMVDMYANCGSVAEAQEVFAKLPVRNVVSWNAMIKGYGVNHEGNKAVQCFEDMQKWGVKPDAITFSCLLTACSHTNLVFEGQEYFQIMCEEYGIAPKLDQFTCMVDVLAQAGHLYEAENFIETMRRPPPKETWTALLSACKTYGEAQLGLRCFGQLVQMNPESAASYILMSNMYASASRLDDAYRIEELRRLAGVKKRPASALIEVHEKVHEFVVGINQYAESLAMLELLSSRVKGDGHVPHLDLVLRPIYYDERRHYVCM